MDDDRAFLPEHGKYAGLLSYRKTEIIYDPTFCFCHRFLRRNDRTIDQMIQAARSGKQNIAEGSQAAKTSKETELKLTNVARASLEELLIDYQDYLRVWKLKQWEKDSPEALFVRQLGRTPNESYDLYRKFCETRPGEVVANIALCLMHQANYLLNRQIRCQQIDLVKIGQDPRTIDECATETSIKYETQNCTGPDLSTADGG
ncbi:MAG: four helix bundle protein [Blastocatellia bacterium]|jgi:four helix bundle protein